MPAPKIAGTIRSKNPLKGAVEVLPERLYYAALKQPPPSHNILASTPKRDPNLPKEKKQIHFFNVDQELVYWNFFLDFGPLNLGQLTRFCLKLNDKLRKFPVVCFYSSTNAAKRANAIFLICAWQVLYLKRSPRQAHSGFEQLSQQQQQQQQSSRQQPDKMQQDDNGADDTGRSEEDDNDDSENNTGNGQKNGDVQQQSSLPPVSQSQGAPTIAPLPPFHDASPVACTYHLSVIDCLDGMVKAIQFGFWSMEDFDLEEYEHFEQVENGDLNWLVKGRILAFAGPSYQRHVSPEGYCTLAPSDYIPYFKQQNVDLVVRLNKKNYHERDFVQAGIRHVEHFFVDGSCPSMKVLNAVLQDFEAVPADKAFAVHCKAGLGRTGTCIGAYLMKHYRFTAAEVIGWMRICRPGCVIGPQQQFLQTIEGRMWQAGDMRHVPRAPKLKLQADTAADVSAKAQATPDSPRQRLTRDAVEGRAGQGESLLAARANRGTAAAAAASNSPTTTTTSFKAGIPTPPITPEPKEKRSAVVTPDSATTPSSSSSGGGGGGNKKNNSAGSCDEAAAAMARSGVCGANSGSWLS